MPPYRSGGRLQPKQLPSAQGACRLGLCREIQALQMAAGTLFQERRHRSAIRFTYPDVKNDNRVAFVTAVSGMTSGIGIHLIRCCGPNQRRRRSETQ